ncbi:MAG: stage II sporulation protein M [archaeon]
MFEAIVSPRHAERNPYSLFLVGMLYSSLSLFLVSIITKGDAVMMKHAPMLLIAFTTIFSIPFIHSLIRREEIDVINKKGGIFARHFDALLALLFLFLGFLVAFSLWYIVLPDNSVAAHFQSQIEKFCSINAGSMANCVKEYGISPEFLKGTLTGAVTGFGDMSSIFINNLYVMLFTLIFSLAFGAGAIFILAWNASVIAAAIGLLARGNFDFFTPFLTYMFHGIPEIAAYLVIALAGGILSTALIRQDFKHFSSKLIVNILMLVVAAVLLLLAAAFIEAYITPLLF